MEKDEQQELNDHDITLVNRGDSEDDEDDAGAGLGLDKTEWRS
jgi:hypothetical protein